MKNALSLLTLAAGLSQVSATWKNSKSYSMPDNTDNKCTDQQSKGFDWSDLQTGSFSSYGGFNWQGFSCQSGFGKRDGLIGRTYAGKCITGSSSNKGGKSSSPSFSCDSGKGTDKTSVSSFHIVPEFDCDLEFHYDMPDGSSCKHRASCSTSGTTVPNSQCGGAKNVTVVYPSQPSAPKETCSFAIPSISFGCGSSSSTKTVSTHYSTSTPKTSATTTSPGSKTTLSTTTKGSSSSYVASTTSVATTTGPKTTSPVTTISSNSPGSSSYVSSGTTIKSSVSSGTTVSTIVSSGTTSVVTVSSGTTYPATTVTSNSPGSSTTVKSSVSSGTTVSTIVSSGTTSVVTVSSGTTYPATTVTSNSPASSSSVATPSTGVPTTITSVTSYMTTSTVLTTVVSTITSCGSTVSNCPAHSTALTTVTVAVSTTVCPVTETQVITHIPTVSPSSASPSSAKPSGTTTTGNSPVGTTTPAGPVETLPCPGVVPSCLNSWMWTVGCADNTDTACFCPDAAYVNNIFACLYSYGETDDIISQAVQYFQGICGDHIPSNPAIATGAHTYTSALTVTATPTAGASYTTVFVTATTVVPCTNSAGSVIPSSSSTVTISTTVTYPQVGLTTVSAGASASDVVVVPGTVASPTTTAGNAATGKYPTGSAVATANPTGTGVKTTSPAASASATKPVTAGAGRVGSGLGLFGAVAVVIAAL